MAGQTEVCKRPRRDLLVQTFIPEILRGMGVTIKALASVVFNPKENIVTVQYPEETVDYPERYRGQHRLMLRDDGHVRCVACMCCSTACPAECIHIEAAEHDDPNIEKYPRVFVIDTLRCVVCGLCVEACPTDAIRMDTGLHVKPQYERPNGFLHRDLLMELGGRSASEQGSTVRSKL